MWRYQGHSMPGFGVGAVAAVLVLFLGPVVLPLDVQLWHVGAVGLATWVVVDVLSLISLRRKDAQNKSPPE